MLDANIANLLKKAPNLSFTMFVLIVGSLAVYYLANRYFSQSNFSFKFNTARLVGLIPLVGLFIGLIITGTVRITLVAIWKGNEWLMLSGILGVILVWTFFVLINSLLKALKAEE